MASVAPKRVLVLNSFGREFAPFSVFSGHFRSDLAGHAPGAIDFYKVSLESARFADGERDAPFVDYLEALFVGQPPDLVVPLGGPAARFVQRNRKRLFPETPALFAAVDERLLNTLALTDRDAVVAVRNQPAKVIQHVLHVLPDTKNIAVVLGNSPLEKFWLGEVQREFKPLSDRINFIWLNGMSFEEMRNRAAALPPNSAIFYAVMAVDVDGVLYEDEQALAQLHKVARAPIFGLHDYQLGRGVVGGPLMSIRELGRDSAAAAARILAGESPGSIKVPTREAGQPQYDWRELRRWKINERNLPAGSVIAFREPTFWELYRWRVVAAASICTAQGLLIAVLLLNHLRRRRAERSLRESEARFRAVVEAAPSAMIMISPAGEISLVNAQAEAVFGYSRQDLIGQRIESLVPEFQRLTARSMGGGRELFGRREDGTRVPLEIGLNPVSTSQGTFVLASVIDVTARLQAQAEAKQQREELAHLSRVAMLGELSGSLAHELNQPLTAILSNAEAAQRFLQRQPADLHEVQEILEDIVNDDNRAGEVIRRLRLLFKKGELQRNDLDVNETIRDVLKLVNSDLLNHSVSVDTELEEGLPSVCADRVQVQQVLLNLVVNGCDAMVHTDVPDRRLVVRTARSNGSDVQVSVADRGCGIPPNRLEQVFAPFFTTKTHGLGLGLAVCRTIVAAHGGRLWATNNQKHGATFHVVLPCAGADAEHKT